MKNDDPLEALKDEIATIIIELGYYNREQPGLIGLVELRSCFDELDDELFHQLLEDVLSRGWEQGNIERIDECSIRLTPKLIANVENAGGVDMFWLWTNQSLRENLLLLILAHDKNRGKAHPLNVELICEITRLSKPIIVAALDVLSHLQKVNVTDTGIVSPTEYFRKFRRHAIALKELKEDFEKLWAIDRDTSASHRDLSARGHRFEDFIAKRFMLCADEVHTRQSTGREENDILVRYGDVIYVISCKWTRKRVGAEAIRSLRHRVSTRPGAIGILISMSGFTRTAMEEVDKDMRGGQVLLLGPGDVEIMTRESVELRAELNRQRLHYMATAKSGYYGKYNTYVTAANPETSRFVKEKELQRRELSKALEQLPHPARLVKDRDGLNVSIYIKTD